MALSVKEDLAEGLTLHTFWEALCAVITPLRTSPNISFCAHDFYILFVNIIRRKRTVTARDPGKAGQGREKWESYLHVDVHWGYRSDGTKKKDNTIRHCPTKCDGNAWDDGQKNFFESLVRYVIYACISNGYDVFISISSSR